MTTATKMVTRREPLLAQHDLRNILVAAARIVVLRQAAPHLPRSLTCGELQLLTVCAAICEIVVGELGSDANGDSVGDLTVRGVPGLPICHQPRLEDNGK